MVQDSILRSMAMNSALFIRPPAKRGSTVNWKSSASTSSRTSKSLAISAFIQRWSWA